MIPPKAKVNNILITGGAGFIGSWMCHHLIYRNDAYTVVCLDKISNISSLNNLNAIQSHPRFHFIKASLHSQAHLVNMMQEYNIDSVMHFAAESSVQKSFTEPTAFVDANVLGTYHLLEAMRTYGKIVKYVHASTDEVYGETCGSSVDEETRMSPTNPYAASKAAAEMFVMAYQKGFGIPSVVLRCNNILDLGSILKVKLIPRFALLVKDGKKLTMQGDGSRTRNFIYVSDVVNAYDVVLHDGIIGSVYNVSSADEVSVRQVASEILRAFGHDPLTGLDDWVTSIPDRPFNDGEYVVEGRKLRNLGWNQQVTFQEGLERTVKWYLENGDWWWDEIIN